MCHDENGDASNIVTIDETGSNTGVFESQDDDDSEISVSSDAPSGDTFTIGYADDDQQVIVNDFRLHPGADSGRHMGLGRSAHHQAVQRRPGPQHPDADDMTMESDELPALILGDPVTLH